MSCVQQSGHGQEAARAPLLTDDQIREIAERPNGPFMLLEMVRRGYVDSRKAVEAIDRVDSPGFFKRFSLAILDALFAK